MDCADDQVESEDADYLLIIELQAVPWLLDLIHICGLSGEIHADTNLMRLEGPAHLVITLLTKFSFFSSFSTEFNIILEEARTECSRIINAQFECTSRNNNHDHCLNASDLVFNLLRILRYLQPTDECCKNLKCGEPVLEYLQKHGKGAHLRAAFCPKCNDWNMKIISN